MSLIDLRERMAESARKGYFEVTKEEARKMREKLAKAGITFAGYTVIVKQQ